jgi:hypothetical protein
VAVAGSALALASGPASAAPGDPDITGRVVNTAGAGILGVRVWAITTPSDGSTPVYVDQVSTDATGAYTFNDLDAASLDAWSDSPAVIAETQFRLFFDWEAASPAQLHSTGYGARGLGGSKSPRAAQAVTVPPGGTAVAPTQALPAAGGILLEVLGPSGAPVDFGWGGLYLPGAADPFTAFVGRADTGTDDYFYPDGADPDSEPDAPKDGLVYVTGVEPGRYAVGASGEDRNETTGTETRYLSRFFGGDGTYSGAKAVGVAAGSFSRVTIRLTDRMTPLEEPRIIGDSGFGSRLKVDPGAWLGDGSGGLMAVTREDGTDYRYQWLRGSKVVGTGPTYKVTKKDKGKKIRALVTAYRGDRVGTAVTDATAKVGEKSKVTARRIAGGKVAATVEVAKKKLRDKLGTPTGKVVLITKTGLFASAKVKLKNGEAVLSPKKRYAGQKLLVLYLGGGKLGSDTGAVKGR